MVYLMFTSLWPLSTLYFIWLVMDWQTPERGKGNDIIQISMKTEESYKYTLCLNSDIYKQGLEYECTLNDVLHYRRIELIIYTCDFVLSLFQCEHTT